MKTPKIYLETTVFNFLFADDAPEKKADTIKLFEEIKDGKYIPYTSDAVLEELEKASKEKFDQMFALIEKYSMITLTVNEEAKRLAMIYIKEGVIPEKYPTDALHIAVSTVNDLDYVVSYNFKHIVKVKTITMTESINLRENYKRIGIFSPTEVIDND
ncbi:putative PIN domain protein [Candidatus Termititenax aidoneus]|uniref:PIN domain protein n=1 Tax=Termititenax aidoneus TaxID=2218524 RepID=A0A388TCJ9_TERA1|nr:putative PIN domain protein [Candidatus Termititenax aidoneus]